MRASRPAIVTRYTMRIEVSGVWDLFHVGHVRLFQKARALAPPGVAVTLVVGVHSDEVVAAYKRTPVIPHDDRVEMVRSCRLVDEVIPNAPIHVTKEYLSENKIDIVAHAHEIGDRAYDEYYAVPMRTGQFRRLEYTPSTSTSEIIARARAL